MKSKNIILTFLILILATTFLTACLAVVTPFDSSVDEKRKEEKFNHVNDVPYPAHFGLDKKNTTIHQLHGVLSGVIVVAGRMNIDEIGAYYDERLPFHGWKPVAQAQSNKLVSTWQKDNRILTIIAQPSSVSIASDTRLELWLGAPFTESDLGNRVMYKKPTNRGENFSTTPSGIFNSDGGNANNTSSDSYYSSSDFAEEDI